MFLFFLFNMISFHCFPQTCRYNLMLLRLGCQPVCFRVRAVTLSVSGEWSFWILLRKAQSFFAPANWSGLSLCPNLCTNQSQKATLSYFKESAALHASLSTSHPPPPQSFIGLHDKEKKPVYLLSQMSYGGCILCLMPAQRWRGCVGLLTCLCHRVSLFSSLVKTRGTQRLCNLEFYVYLIIIVN